MNKAIAVLFLVVVAAGGIHLWMALGVHESELR